MFDCSIGRLGDWENYRLPITNYQLPITNYQLPTLNSQLSIDRERGRSHYNYQLSTIN
ncbi:MAG: hypothetical protein ACRC62_27125 [Microcoleus sp.]